MLLYCTEVMTELKKTYPDFDDDQIISLVLAEAMLRITQYSIGLEINHSETIPVQTFPADQRR